MGRLDFLNVEVSREFSEECILPRRVFKTSEHLDPCEELDPWTEFTAPNGYTSASEVLTYISNSYSIPVHGSSQLFHFVKRKDFI